MDWEQTQFGDGEPDEVERKPFGLGQLKLSGDSVTVEFESDPEEREGQYDRNYYSFEGELADTELGGDRELKTGNGDPIQPGEKVVLNAGSTRIMAQIQAYVLGKDDPTAVGEVAKITSNGGEGTNREYEVEFQ